MSEIVLLKVNSTRRAEFIAAWEISFSRKIGTEIYDWIFDDENIIYSALINNEIVAGYCLYPFKAIVNSEEKSVLLCNNVFVHPQHQGKYLFVKLGKLALHDAGQMKYGEIAYGIPNKLALSGHQRVGWGVQDSIKFLSKIRTHSSKQALRDWQFKLLTQKQREDIELCSRESSKGRAFSILKTAKFIEWRFESKPGVNYWFGLKYRNDHILAYCVCKYFEQGNVLHFIDIDGYDDESINQLIIEAESLNGNFDRLNLWGTSAKISSFIKNGYEFDGAEDNLIFIQTETLKSVNFSGDLNINLSDNDVY